MARYHDPNLVPKNGSILKVIVLDRISGGPKQTEKSNENQRAGSKDWVLDRFDGAIEWTIVSDTRKGEELGTDTVAELEMLIATGLYDAAVMEDLGRYLRRIHAYMFCEHCEDHNTRLVAINDQIDTSQNWRINAIFAAAKHEAANKDTSDRLKNRLRYRFLDGDIVQTLPAGYIKEGKADKDVRKDSEAEAVYDEWFRRLEDGQGYSEVADWLNSIRFPTGKWCRSSTWTGAMVRRVTYNPILKGIRIRNRRKSKRVNRTGKYVSVKAAAHELLERPCPHLAFIEPARYDRLIADLDKRYAKYSRGDNPPACFPPRPRSDSRWPSHHVYCGICRHMFRFGGHGQKERLLCRGACEYHCWNTITFDGPAAAEKISSRILAEIMSLPEFDECFLQLLEQRLTALRGGVAARLELLARDEEQTTRQLENVRASLRDAGPSPALIQDLHMLERRLASLAYDRGELEQLPERKIIIPSMETIRQQAVGAITGLAHTSREFGRVVRKLIPAITVYPCRLIDGGHLGLRARFTLTLASLAPDVHHFPDMAHYFQRELVVDLFEPPQREVFRNKVMSLRTEGKTEREAAATLGITIAAAQHAAALQRMMDQRDLTDPYVLVTNPPSDYPKLCAHKHPRYRFEPLSDSGAA